MFTTCRMYTPYCYVLDADLRDGDVYNAVGMGSSTGSIILVGISKVQVRSYMSPSSLYPAGYEYIYVCEYLINGSNCVILSGTFQALWKNRETAARKWAYAGNVQSSDTNPHNYGRIDTAMPTKQDCDIFLVIKLSFWCGSCKCCPPPCPRDPIFYNDLCNVVPEYYDVDWAQACSPHLCPLRPRDLIFHNGMCNMVLEYFDVDWTQSCNPHFCLCVLHVSVLRGMMNYDELYSLRIIIVRLYGIHSATPVWWFHNKLRINTMFVCTTDDSLREYWYDDIYNFSEATRTESGFGDIFMSVYAYLRTYLYVFQNVLLRYSVRWDATRGVYGGRCITVWTIIILPMGNTRDKMVEQHIYTKLSGSCVLLTTGRVGSHSVGRGEYFESTIKVYISFSYEMQNKLDRRYSSVYFGCSSIVSRCNLNDRDFCVKVSGINMVAIHISIDKICIINELRRICTGDLSSGCIKVTCDLYLILVSCFLQSPRQEGRMVLDVIRTLRCDSHSSGDIYKVYILDTQVSHYYDLGGAKLSEICVLWFEGCVQFYGDRCVLDWVLRVYVIQLNMHVFEHFCSSVIVLHSLVPELKANMLKITRFEYSTVVREGFNTISICGLVESIYRHIAVSVQDVHSAEGDSDSIYQHCVYRMMVLVIPEHLMMYFKYMKWLYNRCCLRCNDNTRLFFLYYSKLWNISMLCIRKYLELRQRPRIGCTYRQRNKSKGGRLCGTSHQLLVICDVTLHVLCIRCAYRSVYISFEFLVTEIVHKHFSCLVVSIEFSLSPAHLSHYITLFYARMQVYTVSCLYYTKSWIVKTT